jgi:uncharacterized protein
VKPRPLGLDLTADQWSLVTAVLQQYAADYTVWAFGSRVKQTAQRFSDLDLVLITHAPLPLDRTAELREAFGESDLPFSVDIVDWTSAAPALRQAIAQHHVVLQTAAR